MYKVVILRKTPEEMFELIRASREGELLGMAWIREPEDYATEKYSHETPRSVDEQMGDFLRIHGKRWSDGKGGAKDWKEVLAQDPSEYGMSKYILEG